MRRLPRRLGAASLLLALLWAPTACTDGSPERTGDPAAPVEPPAPARDVLLITVDTLRADALGYAGNPRAETPTLDRLAAAGRVFPRAHAHNVVTLPSHANILTGLYPYEHGVRDNSGFRLPPSIPTAGTLFHEAGFATAAVVGAFPLDARFGLDRGFDLYDDRYPEGSAPTDFRLVERPGDEVVARALSWWRDHAGERRFLWVHLFDAHAPYEPPEPWASRFRDQPYLGEVAAVDSYLTPLVGPLLDEGPNGGPLIVFTADHGEALGDHGEMTHGLFAYEATLHVPLVVRAPGVAPATVDDPARHIDVLPTLLAGAGLPVPDDLPGRSLLQPAEHPEKIVSYFESLTANLDRGWAPLRGVIEGGDKLISLPIPELYDLSDDPAEEHNLFDAEPRRARELARLLPKATGPIDRRAADASEAAALRSLGYLSGSAAGKTTYTAADDPKNLISVDRQVFEFINLYESGDLERATTVARSIVESQPDMSLGYYHLAQVLIDRGRTPEAMAVLQKAVDRGVADRLARRQLALLLAQAGRADEGVELMAPLASTGDPDDLTTYGQVLSEAGRQDAAREALEQVFDTDPRNPAARSSLALVALRTGSWTEAEAQARKALDLNDALPDAWNYLGVALYNQSRAPEALDAWDRALALDPESYDVLFNEALVAAEVGDHDRARRALERFVASAPPERYGPDLAKARALLGQMRRAGGR